MGQVLYARNLDKEDLKKAVVKYLDKWTFPHMYAETAKEALDDIIDRGLLKSEPCEDQLSYEDSLEYSARCIVNNWLYELDHDRS